MNIRKINMKTTPKEYLNEKRIEYKESGNELVLACLFGCDDDSRPGERHMYMCSETGQYHCKKCDGKGNLLTLAKHFGDELKSYKTKPSKKEKSSNPEPITPEQVESWHNALTTDLRSYLNNRGIPDDLINKFKLGFGTFYGKEWITIPIKDIDGNYPLVKLRKLPDDTSDSPKMLVYPKGAEHQLFNIEAIKESSEIMICEGEFDCLVLLSQGIPAITSTGGCSTFKDEWFEYIKNLDKVTVCFDKDEPGKKAALELVKRIVDLDSPEVFKINLPEDMKEGHKDITDFFIHEKRSKDQFLSLVKKMVSFEDVNRVKEVKRPRNEVTFSEWKNIIKSNFPDCAFPAEVILSTITQLLINDITNPFALVLIDVPSAGKTITINFFSEIKDLTYSTDKFTPASFVSNATNVRKDQLKDIDLLPRIRYKLFLIRDLAPLFGERDDDLLKSLGLLTRVLDGEGLQTDSGIHGQREYVGDYLFMMVAGSTPIQPRVWKTMGNLGARLFFLNMNSKDKSESELADQLMGSSYKIKENKCKKTTKEFLYSLWNKYPKGIDWDKSKEDIENLRIIARCAKLLAKLRGTINVWKDSSQNGESYDHTNLVIEKPDRINQLLYNLCRGHALACGRTSINHEDLKLAIEISIDSAPNVRANLIRKLLEKEGKLKTTQIEVALGCSKPTALKEMEKLKILGVVYVSSLSATDESEKEIKLISELEWFLSEECKKIRGLPLPQRQRTLSDLVNQSDR
jgi:5S rRNA maturation endonuclease (ribonuclease M5)